MGKKFLNGDKSRNEGSFTRFSGISQCVFFMILEQSSRFFLSYLFEFDEGKVL